MNIILEKIEINKKFVLENLFQLYLHDIIDENSSDIKMNENGLFDNNIDGYWIKEECITSFLIKNDNEIVGFIVIGKPWLVLKKENDSYSIVEMFILNKYKRKGIGKNVVLQLFKKYIGKWEIATLPNSKERTLFWEKIISEYTCNKFTANYLGTCSTPVYTFENIQIENNG